MAAFSEEINGKRRLIGRAPGRIDLMGGTGGHTGSLVLQLTTSEATWATIELREDPQILLFNPQMRERGWEEHAEFSLEDLSSDERVRQRSKATPELRWTAYALGAFFLLKQWFPNRVTRGANVFIKSEVPLRTRAGASAVLGVAVMQTANSASA